MPTRARSIHHSRGASLTSSASVATSCRAFCSAGRLRSPVGPAPGMAGSVLLLDEASGEHEKARALARGRRLLLVRADRTAAVARVVDRRASMVV